MEPEEYVSIAEQEGHHWWYVGMRRIVASFLETVASSNVHGRGWRILDAGCGPGGTSRSLRQWGTVVGLDFAEEAVRLAQSGGGMAVVRGSVTALPFRSASFDLVTSFDVLYHVGVVDDGEALSEMARVLRPGGWLLVRVPAFEFLRTGHDVIVHTARRYRAPRLRASVEGAGLNVVRMSYANTLLFPVAVLRALRERVLRPAEARSAVQPVPAPLNAVLKGLLQAEAWWLRRWSFPFGVSLLCLAQKPRGAVERPRAESLSSVEERA